MLVVCALTRHLSLAGGSDGVDLGKGGWNVQITWFGFCRLTPELFPPFKVILRTLIVTLLHQSPISHGQRLGKLFP